MAGGNQRDEISAGSALWLLAIHMKIIESSMFKFKSRALTISSLAALPITTILIIAVVEPRILQL